MSDDRLRIDKWLWFARLAKTRTASQKLAVSGRVRVNRQKNDNAAYPVKIGDVLTITLDRSVRVLRITAVGSRRGPATEARRLYDDLSPPPPPRLPTKQRGAGTGRPTKRERRELDNFRANSFPFGDEFPSGSD